jgi:hypothetical protein
VDRQSLYPNLLFEKLIGNITYHEANIQDQHLAAVKSIVEKRQRRFKEEEKAKKLEERLELLGKSILERCPRIRPRTTLKSS